MTRRTIFDVCVVGTAAGTVATVAMRAAAQKSDVDELQNGAPTQ
jgi:hypothetical protein